MRGTEMFHVERVEAEVYDLLAELAPGASSYLGVGIQEGRCLERVIEANPAISRLVLCDTWGMASGGTGRGDHDHIAAMLFEMGYVGQVEWLDGPSAQLIPTVGRPVDLSYVDGDHTYEGALIDLQNVWPLTRKVMVVHDTEMWEVDRALEAFLLAAKLVGEIASVFRSYQDQGTAVVRRYGVRP